MNSLFLLQDGRPYTHCSTCSRCVKETYVHCTHCDRCHIPTFKCKQDSKETNQIGSTATEDRGSKHAVDQTNPGKIKQEPGVNNPPQGKVKQEPGVQPQGKNKHKNQKRKRYFGKTKPKQFGKKRKVD